jgi:hypothetical protein
VHAVGQSGLPVAHRYGLHDGSPGEPKKIPQVPEEQVLHAPTQAVLQHVPSEQKPLEHCEPSAAVQL